MRSIQVSLAGALAAGLVLVAPAYATDDGKTKTATPSPAAATSVHQSAMQAFIDPETGQLVSQPVTAQQRHDAAAGNGSRQDDAGTVRATAADGSTMYYLNGAFQMSMSVQVDENGKQRAFCSDAAHQAMGQHNHPTASAAADER